MTMTRRELAGTSEEEGSRVTGTGTVSLWIAGHTIGHERHSLLYGEKWEWVKKKLREGG